MSSDSTSTEKPGGAEDRGPEDAIESLDQSLEAIMKEVQQADGPVGGEAIGTSPEAVEPGDPAPAETVTADVEMPIPSEAFRPDRDTAENAAVELAALSSELEPPPESPPPDDPFADLAIEEVEAEAVVESILATAGTRDESAELPSEETVDPMAAAEPARADELPPSDEALLANIVLPAAHTAPSAVEALPALMPEVGDDDRTMISALPPEVEPAPVRLPAPTFSAPEKARRVTPTWPGTETVKPTVQPIGRLPRPPSRGLLRTVREVASHRVNASVAQLAIVVVSATAFGAAAVRVLGPGATANPGAEAIVVPERPAQPHFESLPPRPPEIAPLPSAPVEVIEPAAVVEVEKPKARPVRKRVARPAPPPAAPEATAERAAEPAAADPSSHAAAPAKKAPAAKPRPTRHVAQQGWVDPFGD
jgi:hypothetical protein